MKKFIKISLFTFLGLLALYLGLYLYAWISPKLQVSSSNSYYFYDMGDNLITGMDEWTFLEDISKDVVDATVAVEDRHFFNHLGFDYLRIGKALYSNFLTKTKDQGASTITQQYAKNLFLPFDKTWSRKINEAWLTIRLEMHYTKEEILEGYLNTINYGGVFGIENASKYYFNKKSKDLTLAEAALLAGIPKTPSYYSPYVNAEAAKKRQITILNIMYDRKYITKEELDNALKQDLVYTKGEERQNSSTIMYYQDAVLEELKSINSIPGSFLKTGGLKIYTNLDMNAQKTIEDTAKKYLKDDSEIQNAGIIMNPNTGQVLALVGGKDYSVSQFNRALSNNRGVGSSIKPFLFYSALENGFTPSSNFTSEKTTFVFGDNQTYSPNNYSDLYGNRSISLAAAISYSDNIFAVKTHLFLGEQNLVDMMKRVGVKTKLEALPSLALGSQGISILEMSTAYSAFANEGYKVEPYFIRKVEDINGNVLYEKEPSKEAVLNRSTTYILNELLTTTYNKDFIDYGYPTAEIIAYKLKNKYAIKTGTTDSDHVMFGYNKDVVVGLWSGFDDNRKISGTDIYNNKHMWADVMEGYMAGKEAHWYTMPNNVVGVLIDPVSGKVASNNASKKVMMYYVKGTEPSTDYNLDDAIPTIKQDE